jgi:hypothetical protein
MFSAMRRRLHLSPATVIAGLALVFAMTGGAYAAKKYLITSTKQISPSVLKQLQGKAGAAGAPGVAGAQGAQGPAGPAGAQGSAGSAGAKGEPGAKGEKGAAGTNGEDGMCSAGNPECKLASGATLTGAWGTSGQGIDLVQISFPVRVSPAPTALAPDTIATFKLGVVLKDKAGEFYGPHAKPETLEEIEEDQAAFAATCPGDVAEPKASPGFLCLYEGSSEGSGVSGPISNEPKLEAAHEFGLVVPFGVADSTSSSRGSWAVTAK